MKRSELWEIRIGFLSAFVAAAGVIVSVLIYVHGLKASIEKEQQLINARSQKEYERKLWDERRENYKELASTLGTIASEIEVENKISKESLKSFSKAYWGSLIMVEDESVKNEMVKLKNDLRDLSKNRISNEKIKLRIERIISLSKNHLAEVIVDEPDS
jgi:hypothetical protein